jgi:hypothetical protein
MLNLFKNIFGQPDDAAHRLPESLIADAIERAVDGTDPRVRIVSGYAKTLRRPVIHAIKYVIDMVDSFPPPVVLDPAALSGNPACAALFYSKERMDQILGRDAALLEFRAQNPLAAGAVTALLVAQRTDKRTFGTAQVGEQVLSDMPRTTVSFDQHRLLDPAANEAETRRLLKHRAYDFLLSIALCHITERKSERDNLGNRKALLRSKLDIVRRGKGFAQQTSVEEQAKLQASLADIEQQLAALGPAENMLEEALASIVEILMDAGRHFWVVNKLEYLDQFYVLHDKPESAAPGTQFMELHDSESRQATAMLINIPLQ